MKTTEDIVKETHALITTVSPETTVFEAVSTMVANKIGAILIMENEEITGIWTERDLMRNILVPGFDPKTSKIKDLMQKGVHSVAHDVTVNKLLDTFVEYGDRYLLVKKNQRYTGLVEITDAIKGYYLELRSYFTLTFYESPLRKPKKYF